MGLSKYVLQWLFVLYAALQALPVADRELLATAGRWTKPPAFLELILFLEQSFKPINLTLGPTSCEIVAVYADGQPACLV